MKKISVICVVYNEEKRIENYIKSFNWSNDLIVVNKSSTDKTAKILKEYNIKSIDFPFSFGGGKDQQRAIEVALQEAKNEWVLLTTTSDLIHPELVKKISQLINQPYFDFDVVYIPFSRYVFGLNKNYSPWYGNGLSASLIKKDKIILGGHVHQEISFKTSKIFKMDISKKGETLMHLTHENIDNFLNRHITYTQLETDRYSNEKVGLRSSLKELLKAIAVVTIKKRTIFKGWDGLALGLAYVSYFILKYLYVWEKFRGKGSQEYKKIRQETTALWSK